MDYLLYMGLFEWLSAWTMLAFCVAWAAEGEQIEKWVSDKRWPKWVAAGILVVMVGNTVALVLVSL